VNEPPDGSAPGQPRAQQWPVPVYRIPSEPTRLRAGVWRKLKGLGAVYIQAAALPASPTSERSLRALRAEIAELGGTAHLFDTYAELEENEVDLVKLRGRLDRIRERARPGGGCRGRPQRPQR
jgi:hypothetical protein